MTRLPDGSAKRSLTSAMGRVNQTPTEPGLLLPPSGAHCAGHKYFVWHIVYFSIVEHQVATRCWEGCSWLWYCASCMAGWMRQMQVRSTRHRAAHRAVAQSPFLQ